MKLCIPLGAPFASGASDAPVEPHLPHARQLYLFDTETRLGRTLDLHAPGPQDETFRIEAVLCASIDRVTLRQLLSRGIKVYGTDAETVLTAIGLYESGALEAVEAEPTGCSGQSEEHGGSGCGGGGGCGGHGQSDGHAHGKGGCGCSGHGAQGADAGHAHAGHGCGGKSGKSGCGGGGCGAHADEVARQPSASSDGLLRIAVCSQNRKTVTDHAGKCRKFWIYTVCDGVVVARELLELPLEQSLHATAAGEAHPLDGVDVLIAGSMGGGLQQKLRARGVAPRVTDETDLEAVVAAFLAGALPEPVASACAGGCGGH